MEDRTRRPEDIYNAIMEREDLWLENEKLRQANARLVEASTKLMNLEDDYQAEDTSGLHYAVQYWIEEKARRKAELMSALVQNKALMAEIEEAAFAQVPTLESE